MRKEMYIPPVIPTGNANQIRICMDYLVIDNQLAWMVNQFDPCRTRAEHTPVPAGQFQMESVPFTWPWPIIL